MIAAAPAPYLAEHHEVVVIPVQDAWQRQFGQPVGREFGRDILKAERIGSFG